MFNFVLTQFEAYISKCMESSGSITDLEAEIRRKLEQLNWVVSRCQVLNGAVVAEMPGIGEDFKQEDLDNYFSDMKLQMELEILTESFYTIAWRIYQILKQIPGTKNFECKEVRGIRNLLMVHPEDHKENPKTFPMFSMSDGQEGPKIKGYVTEGHPVEDNGLFYNAKKFEGKLRLAVTKFKPSQVRE
jgi:hypothetical protein